MAIKEWASVADPGFARWWSANPWDWCKTYYLTRFLLKTAWRWKKWDPPVGFVISSNIICRIAVYLLVAWQACFKRVHSCIGKKDLANWHWHCAGFNATIYWCIGIVRTVMSNVESGNVEPVKSVLLWCYMNYSCYYVSMSRYSMVAKFKNIKLIPKWNGNSLNSANSQNLKNHWSMNWGQVKGPHCYLCLSATVVASWFRTQEVAGLKTLL